MAVEITSAQIEYLARYFNARTKMAFRFGKQENRDAISGAFERLDGNMAEITRAVREYVISHEPPFDLITCFNGIGVEKKEEQAPAPAPLPVVETPAPVVPHTEVETKTAMGILTDVVIKLISETKQKDIENMVLAGVEDKVREFIRSEYGAIERKVITVVDGKKAEVGGVTHEKFGQICQFVANNEPVFLTGPAGCGKNVLCQQVAKALGLDFYFSNAITQEYKITGFTDAMGVFHESQFYKAFKNGGLFMLDEMDASIPEVLVILNAAIANRYFDFPAPIGYVEAHPDFRVVAAGNTFGLGANYEYVGRNQLDMASLDRFAMVQVGYDRNIELNVAAGNAELVDFCEDFRKAAEKGGVKVIVSYRAIGRIAKLEQLMGVSEVLRTCLVKSLETDDINAILSNMDNKSGKYYRAVKELTR